MSTAHSLALLLILIGGAVGSFAAVLATRLPKGDDPLRKPSHCEACDRTLPWREKLPVVSYIWLRGACSACKAPIPRLLFYAEVLGILLACAAVWRGESAAQMVLGALYLWCLLALALCDLRAFRLPDVLTRALLLLGLALALENPARTLPNALLAAAVASAIFLAIRLGYMALRGREGLGLGDVKMAAGIGAGLGLLALPYVALIAAISALIVATGAARLRGQPVTGTLAIPFGAYLALGAAVAWVVSPI